MQALPMPQTHLTLERYSRIIGIPPTLFWGAIAEPFNSYSGACQDPVTRLAWQKPRQASRTEIAGEIARAESELAAHLGYSVAPEFIVNEMARYPRDYRTLSAGSWSGLRGPKGVKLGRGKLISGGTRAVTLIDSVTDGAEMVYTDTDGDTFKEEVIITVSTTVTDPREIGVFYTGHAGDPRYEIGKAKSVTISGGTCVIKFHTWQFVDPEIDSRWPDDAGYEATNLMDNDNLLDDAEVYRVWVDTTDPWVRIFEQDTYYLNPDQVRYEDGTFAILDVDSGYVIPTPAIYDEDAGTWGALPCSFSSPTSVRTSYYAGDVSQDYINSRTVDPLKDEYARAIAYMATARLNREPCSCTEPLNWYNFLSQDLSKQGEISYVPTRAFMSSEFGVRRGEVMAWEFINKVSGEKAEVAVL